MIISAFNCHRIKISSLRSIDNSVRALLCGALNNDERATLHGFHSRMLCGVLLCSLRSITQAAHQARARCLTLTIAADAARSGRFTGSRRSLSRPFRYSAHA